MSARKQFPYPDKDIEIYLHPDGSLTIEVEADYGDSEIGWCSTYKTIYLSAEEVTKFRKFIGEESNG